MSDKLTEQELEGYYRREPRVTERAILAFLRDSYNPQMIVYGAKAVNAYLPDWLDKETKDWDIMTEGNAEQLASKLESKLDKHYGGDFFQVEPAIHPGTFRIRSRVTGVVVADVSLKDKEIEFKRIDGINYASLDYLESDVKKILADPEARFRHSKDRDTLQRIRVYRAARRKRREQRAGRGSGYVDGSSIDTSMRGFR